MKFFLLFFSPLFLILTTGCPSSDSSNKKLDGPTGTSAYAKSSCSFDFNSGDRFPPREVSSYVVETYFNKRFDRAHLEAVLPLSAAASAEFMRLDGVDVFHVPVKPDAGACSVLASLPEASAGLLKKWQSFDQGGLIGLFLSEKDAIESGGRGPTILVRPDTDRYTMVHEYMHFLFEEDRAINGMPDHKAKEIYVTALARARAILALDLDADASDRLATEYVDASVAFLRALLIRTESYALEEVTIEANLATLMAENKIQGASSFDRENSAAYIRSSLEKAEKVFKDIRKVLTDDLLVRFAKRLSKESELESVYSQVRDDQAEGNRIRSLYGHGRYLEKTSLASGMATRSGNRSGGYARDNADQDRADGRHVGCHHQEVENLISDLQSLIHH